MSSLNHVLSYGNWLTKGQFAVWSRVNLRDLPHDINLRYLIQRYGREGGRVADVRQTPLEIDDKTMWIMMIIMWGDF